MSVTLGYFTFGLHTISIVFFFLEIRTWLCLRAIVFQSFGQQLKDSISEAQISPTNKWGENAIYVYWTEVEQVT